MVQSSDDALKQLFAPMILIILMLFSGIFVQAMQPDNIHLAAKRGDNTAALKFILEDKTKTLVNLKNEQGRTPLHEASSSGLRKMVTLLCDHGASIEETSNNGFTALHYAAFNGYVGVVLALLDRGAPINAKDNIGQTPLHEASCQGYKEVVELLCDRGADNKQQNNMGQTPLHCAAMNGNKKVIHILLVNGAEIDQRDKSGKTALHIATEDGKKDAIYKLLFGKANPEIPDNKGRIPLADNFCRKIFEIIQQSRAKNCATNAFLMGLHPRTGRKSPVRNLLSAHLVLLIMRFVPLESFKNHSPKLITRHRETKDGCVIS